MPEMNGATPQVAQQERQRTDTPEEAKIRRQILSIPRSPRAQETVKNLHTAEEGFLHHMLSNPGTDQRTAYDQQVRELTETMGETIVSGAENLTPLRGRPVLIVANHFGVTKYTLVDNEERDGHRPIDVPVDEIQTFPVRAAMFGRVAEALGDPLRETAVELPGVLGQAQRDAGVLVIPASGEGRTKRLTDDVQEAVATDGNSAIIVYPEGGTSGKKSGQGPYHLESFGTGAFVIAAQTGIPLVPTCVVFDGETGEFKLHVLPPVTLTQEDLQIDGKLGQVTEETRTRMQEALDSATGQKN